VRLRSQLGGPLGALLAFAGCGAPPRPPTLGDLNPIDAGGSIPADASTSLVGDGGIPELSCSLGPEGGVCACADEPLALDPPTLYYVLDRSGSMAELNKWSTVQTVLDQVMIQLGPRARFAAAVFPDPAHDGCAPGVQVFPAPPNTALAGDAPAGKPGPTDLAMLETLGRIAASGGTPTAATLNGLAPAIESISGKTYVILATDGGPNCNANASCSAASCTDNIDGAQGCPSDGGLNCCDPSVYGSVACLDAQPTLDAVAALAAAGIPVYVVGVPGSKPYADLLDQLAMAGGTARGSEPQYYAVDTADESALFSAMSQIAARIAGTCSLTLSQDPPDPSLINVFLDGAVLPQSGPDGWMLDGAMVTVLGASCDEIMNGDVLDVRVVAGCPTVTQ
jgi:hypothetical protein